MAKGEKKKIKIPEFLREFIWCFYPPRYKEISEKRFRDSLKYMSKVLLIAFLITGILFIPKLLLLKGTMRDQFAQFDSFTLSGNVTQNGPVMVPTRNPWIVIDLNSNITLTNELFLIDAQSVQYRLFTPKKIPREQLREVNNYRPQVTAFLTALLLLMLPGIAILLYIRMWLKYFLMVIVMGTLMFIIFDLSRFKLKWKKMLNVAVHAMTPVLVLEVVASFVTTIFLLPLPRPFLGVQIYAVSLIAMAVIMIFGIVGLNAVSRKQK